MMHSLGISGEGEIRAQLANLGSRGKMLLKWSVYWISDMWIFNYKSWLWFIFTAYLMSLDLRGHRSYYSIVTCLTLIAAVLKKGKGRRFV